MCATYAHLLAQGYGRMRRGEGLCRICATRGAGHTTRTDEEEMEKTGALGLLPGVVSLVCL